jgi:replication factor C large subunit
MDSKDSKPWVNKYIPKNVKDVIGQDKPVSELIDFIKNYKKSGKKCCIIHGGVGSGKTSAVHAIANEQGFELIEMNASDFRNKDAIEGLLGRAVGQQSLFFRPKLILVDEVDGLSGNKDRGGIQAIKEVIENSTFPIICTVNDVFDDKLSSLKKIAKLIEFNTLDYKSIAGNLIMILRKEGAQYEEEAVKALARRAGNDMRAAITDLQTTTGSGTRKLDISTVKENETNDRNRTESMANAIMKVLKSTDISIIKGAFDSVDEDIDSVMLWLQENIPKEYEGEDLKNALMMLSKADVYKGRIRRWQHWRFLVYIYALCSAGVALSKKKKYQKPAVYTESKRLLKMWISNQKFAKRKAVATKIAHKSHAGIKAVIRDLMPYIKTMCKNKEFRENLQKEYELEEEEMEWLLK